MRTIRTSVTATDLITLTELKTKLGVTSANYDDELTGIIASVVDRLDGARGVLNSSLRVSSWTSHLDSFPIVGSGIRLPYGPVRSLTAVEYDNEGGMATNITSDCFLRHMGRYAMVCSHEAWPSDIKQKPTTEPVRVEYEAGYDTIPAPIKRVALALAASQFDQSGYFSETVYKRHPQYMSMIREYKF